MVPPEFCLRLTWGSEDKLQDRDADGLIHIKSGKHQSTRIRSP
jgi:hypothetical protein